MRWWFLPLSRLAGRSHAREARSAARTAPRMPGGLRPWPWGAGLAGALVILHFLLFSPVPHLEANFPAAGQIAKREIRAPFAFKSPLLAKNVEEQQEERIAREPPVLRRVEIPGDQQQPPARLRAWEAALSAQLADTATSLDQKLQALAANYPGLALEDLRRILGAEDPEHILRAMSQVMASVWEGGLVDMLPAGNYARVRIVTDTSESLEPVADVVPMSRLVERLAALLRTRGLSGVETVWAVALLRDFLTPNLIYDSAATRERAQEAAKAVPTAREFMEGERIVDRGVRVTEQEAQDLATLKGLLAAQGGSAQGRRIVHNLTRFLLLLVTLALFFQVARVHSPEVLARPRYLAAEASMLALFLVGAAATLHRPSLGPFAVPVAPLALWATILFGDRVGYATTFLGIVLLALLPGVATGIVFAWLVLGVVTVLAVRKIQKRSQSYQTIALLTGLSLFLVTVVRLDQGVGLVALGREYLVALFATVLWLALALFLLPIIEPVVGVCSELTLLELSDLNHPLLKRMALEAQGTYHHSQVVAQLAEQAARAIGANALLTRVGALFHDIGKLQKQEYFVENQRAGYNRHDELSPSMSALVVSAHVKDGIELGRKWRLPQAVIDFIPQHHGTTVMEYFYHKALESGGQTVKVDDFRYGGPKPQRRETAILMLADAVEAATRSLAKPTPARIKEMTKQIMDKRLLSGELDESHLTLSDLARIREAFVSLLTGIYHARIAYPGQRRDARETERDRERGRERAQPDEDRNRRRAQG